MLKDYVLGLSDVMDAGAVLVEDGKIKSAINEERLVRKKMFVFNPINATNFVLKDINKQYIRKIGIASYSSICAAGLHDAYYKMGFLLTLLAPFAFLIEWGIYFLEFLEKRIWPFKKKRLLKLLGKELYSLKRRQLINHHVCHAAAAHYTSGNQRNTIITMDGYGDHYSTIICVGEGNSVKLFKGYKWGSTIAHLYSRITQFYGYRVHLHEGKITGLAAYGNPNICYKEMEKLLWLGKNNTIKAARFLRVGFNKKKLTKIFGKYKREDVAAALQKRCEDVISEFVRNAVKMTGIPDVALAGGVFANVRFNQKIHELPEVNSIWVYPHMGDGGLAGGAALYAAKAQPYYLDHVYFGIEYTNEQIKEELDRNNLKYAFYKDVEKEIAKLLAKSKVVARFNGPMEYGPRALGNRSILYQTKDPTVNDWLNKKLKRTEFMPYAPSTLYEYAEKSYKNVKGAEHAAQFMTITFDCTDWMKKNCPAVVHLDGTARPQLVRKEVNPSYYKIISEFKKLTGVPTILNTSFNMHEEPIVCSPNDAIRSFMQGHLDYLAIGNYIVKNEYK